MISGEFVFVSTLYIKLFELGVEIAFYHRENWSHGHRDRIEFKMF